MEEEYRSDESDDAPDEISNETSKEIQKELEKNLVQEIRQKKNLQKELRRERHEKNKKRKDDKKRRIEELETQKFPEELLALVKEQKEQEADIRNTKELNWQKKKNKKRRKKEINASDGLKVFIEVQPLEKELEKVHPLASRAVEFRNQRLYKNKRIHRISSHQLRMMQDKQRLGGKNKLVT